MQLCNSAPFRRAQRNRSIADCKLRTKKAFSRENAFFDYILLISIASRNAASDAASIAVDARIFSHAASTSS